MAYRNQSFVEHVALRVKDIHWHIKFFYDVLGMDVREIDGPPEAPHQYWTLGGLQLMSTPDFQAPPSNDAGWLAVELMQASGNSVAEFFAVKPRA